MPRLSLDANILIYSVDSSDGARHRRAKRTVAFAARHDCVLVLQVLAEFYFVMVRKGRIPPAQARAQLADFRALFPLALPGVRSLDAAAVLAERYCINFWDAMLLAVARESGVEVMLTEDLQDGQDFGGVRCINPLMRSAAELEKVLRASP